MAVLDVLGEFDDCLGCSSQRGVVGAGCGVLDVAIEALLRVRDRRFDLAVAEVRVTVV